MKKTKKDVATIVEEVMNDEVVAPEVNIPDDVIVENEDGKIVAVYEIGDEVKIIPGSYYVSGVAVPSTILNSKLYIRQKISDDTYAVGIQPSGKIAGAVKVDALVKYVPNMRMPDPEAAFLCLIATDSAHIKSRPDAASKTLKVVHKNGLFTILDEHDGWGHLKIGGWISMDCVKKLNA